MVNRDLERLNALSYYNHHPDRNTTIYRRFFSLIMTKTTYRTTFDDFYAFKLRYCAFN